MSAQERRQALHPEGVPKPIKGYYSNCIKVTSGPLLFIAGQIPIDNDGNLVGGNDVVAQARQVFKNIEAILVGLGGSLQDLVKVTVYVTDIASMHKLAPLRESLFPTNGPVSACVQVSPLAEPEIQIEIEGVAVVD